jgi:hypothetical protein
VYLGEIDGCSIYICFVVFVYALFTRTWAYLNPRSPSLGEPHNGAPLGYPITEGKHGRVAQTGGTDQAKFLPAFIAAAEFLHAAKHEPDRALLTLADDPISGAVRVLSETVVRRSRVVSLIARWKALRMRAPEPREPLSAARQVLRAAILDDSANARAAVETWNKCSVSVKKGSKYTHLAVRCFKNAAFVAACRVLDAAEAIPGGQPGDAPSAAATDTAAPAITGA